MKTIDIYKLHEDYEKHVRKVSDEGKERRRMDGHRNCEDIKVANTERREIRQALKRYDDQLTPEETCILEQLREFTGRPLIFRHQKVAFIRTLDTLQM